MPSKKVDFTQRFHIKGQHQITVSIPSPIYSIVCNVRLCVWLFVVPTVATTNCVFVILFIFDFLSINHQTSRSRITKPPGTFKAAEAE